MENRWIRPCPLTLLTCPKLWFSGHEQVIWDPYPQHVSTLCPSHHWITRQCLYITHTLTSHIIHITVRLLIFAKKAILLNWNVWFKHPNPPWLSLLTDHLNAYYSNVFKKKNTHTINWCKYLVLFYKIPSTMIPVSPNGTWYKYYYTFQFFLNYQCFYWSILSLIRFAVRNLQENRICCLSHQPGLCGLVCHAPSCLIYIVISCSLSFKCKYLYTKKEVFYYYYDALLYCTSYCVII